MKQLRDKIAFLGKFMTPHRRAVIDRVLESRTDQVTIVLEDVYHAQNISAALRTAECLGIQDVHIIERTHRYQVNPRIVKGSARWLSLHRYQAEDHTDPSTACITSLRQSGYTIYATVPDEEEAVSLYELEINHRAAFVFGTEWSGISHSATRQADRLVSIPMYGFTESFNISVCVALVLQQVRRQLQKHHVITGLSEERKEQLRYEWYYQSVRHAGHLLKRMDTL